MEGYITKEKDSIPDGSSIEQLIERKEDSAKQTAESYNEHVANPLNQSSQQYDTAKEKYANTSTTSSKQSIIDDKRQMMGYAIFIINSKFDDNSPLPCAKIDSSDMYILFEVLGFKIEILENKTTDELKEKLTDIRNSIGEDYNYLACIISSHGAEIQLSDQLNKDKTRHVIYTKNEFLPTEEILQEFDNNHCENLAGKPKMFFIQACRCAIGDDKNLDVDPGFDVILSTDSNKKHTRHDINTGVCNKDGDSSRHEKEMTETCVIPCNEDFLVMFASSSGRIGWNDEKKGGWLMHCLFTTFAEFLDTNEKMDLLQILTKVCGKMARDLESSCLDKEVDRTKSAAVVYHMLTKRIYLEPGFYLMVEKIVPSKEKYE